MKKRRRVVGSRIVRIHAYLDQASRMFLARSKDLDGNKAAFVTKHQMLFHMTSMLMAALTIEAHLNLLGEEKVENWDLLLRLQWSTKLKLITRAIRFEIDWSAEPFDALKEIMEFRNKIVHGRVATVEVDEVRDVEEVAIPRSMEELRIPKSHDEMVREIEQPFGMPTDEVEWETMCTLENAERFSQKSRAIVEKLHLAAGIDDMPWRLTSSSYQIWDVSDDNE